MNSKVRRWRLVLRVLVLALIVAALPLPAMAGQPGQPTATPGLRASIAPAVRSVVATMKAPAKVAREQGTDAKAQLESKSFFRTGPGIAVIAILAAGTGYAVYSAKHDRIHSTVPTVLQ